MKSYIPRFLLVVFLIIEGLCIYFFGFLHWLPLIALSIFLAFYFYHRTSNPTFVVGVVLLFLGVIIGIEGYKVHYSHGFNWELFLSDFSTNISTNSVSIAITVIIIDSLNRRREKKEELKTKIICDLRDPNPEIVKRALIELRSRRWLEDGSMQRAYLCGAKLSGADLSHSDFSGAYLNGAILIGTILRNSKLNNTNLSGCALNDADLSNSQLLWANLDGCDLTNTNMSNTDLTGAVVNRKSVQQVYSYKNATMPDGEKFEHWNIQNRDKSSESKNL